MDLDLKSRTALVSGASIGIGRAIAKGLAREGVRVVAVARRKDLLEKLAEECRIADGGSIIPVVQDIMEGDAATRLATAAVSRFGAAIRPKAVEDRTHGGTDAWITKLNAAGGLSWQKCYGGPGNEGVRSLIKSSDGGYIFAGYNTMV